MKSVLLIGLASFSAIALGQVYTVAGGVINTQTGSPMNRMRVSLNAAQGKSPAAIVTGEDGRFSFQVPKGRYGLTAETGGVRQAFGLEGPGIGFGVAILPGPGQDTSHLTFHWFPLGAITGTVTDDRDEPVENALVQLIRAAVVGGRRRLNTISWARADDRGVYRFAPLLGGTYYLAVTAEPWYVTRNAYLRRPLSPDEPEPPSEPTPAYATAYYPAASDLPSASPVIVKPGAEFHADFKLRTVNGVNIHVNCSNAAGRTGMLSLMADRVEGVAAPDGFQRQLSFYGQPQTIVGVPPGRYLVRIQGSGQNPFGVRKTIDVGTSDITVDLPIQPASTVKGKVSFANPAARRKSSMYVRLTNDVTGVTQTRPVDADGSFFFNNVGTAKVRPLIVSTDGFFIAQATADGAPLKNGTFDIADAQAVTLDLVASDEIGHLKGLVMAGDSSVPGVLVVLAPATESSDPSKTHVFQTDSDGSFDWANVSAGDYVLFAIAQLDLEYLNPAAVRPYLALGKPIQVEAHHEYTERIGLSPLAPLERR